MTIGMMMETSQQHRPPSIIQVIIAKKTVIVIIVKKIPINGRKIAMIDGNQMKIIRHGKRAIILDGNRDSRISIMKEAKCVGNKTKLIRGWIAKTISRGRKKLIHPQISMEELPIIVEMIVVIIPDSIATARLAVMTIMEVETSSAMTLATRLDRLMRTRTHSMTAAVVVWLLDSSVILA